MTTPVQNDPIENNLKRLKTAGAGLILALFAGLFVEQLVLNRPLEQLREQTLPLEHNVARANRAMSDIFYRQSQLLTSQNLKQFTSVPAAQDAYDELYTVAENIAKTNTQKLHHTDDQQHFSPLEEQIKHFITTDGTLHRSIQERLQTQETFDAKVAKTNTEIRSLIESTQSLSGHIRLDYILLLREVNRGSYAGNAAAQSLIYGDIRQKQELLADLVVAAVNLGSLSGRFGLAPNKDAIHSILANEYNQISSVFDDRLQKLKRMIPSQDPIYQHLLEIDKKYHSVVQGIADVKSPDSLVSLRNQTFLYEERAKQLRATSAQVAAKLQDTTKKLEHNAASLADIAENQALVGSWITKILSVLLLIFGAWFGKRSSQQISASLSSIQESNHTLRKLKDELSDANSNLEQKVSLRTAELRERNTAIKLVLDNVDQGLFIIDNTGKILPEKSQAFGQWFGDTDDIAWRFFASLDDKVGSWFAMGWEALKDGFLPLDLSLEQMPKRLKVSLACATDKLDNNNLNFSSTQDDTNHTTTQEYIFSLSYKAILRNDEFDQLLVIMTDITADVYRERLESAQRDFMNAVEKCSKDRIGFLEFYREAQNIVEFLRENTLASQEVLPTSAHLAVNKGTDITLLMRQLHTLKGISALQNLHGIAHACHELESRIAETSMIPPNSECDELFQRWHNLQEQMQIFIGDHTLATFVTPTDREHLLEKIRAKMPHRQLEFIVESWRYEPMQQRLSRFAEQIESVAKRVGKNNVKVTVESNDLRLPTEPLSQIWSSFTHLIRNSIDHGVDSVEERRALGKPDLCTVVLKTSQMDNMLFIEIGDDGAGIDWQKLLEKAQRQRMPTQTQADLVDALFTDGISTKDEVTSLSGRGVGLSVVKTACQVLGGDILVVSEIGHGTRFQLCIPIDAVTAKPMPPASPDAAQNTDAEHVRNPQVA